MQHNIILEVTPGRVGGAKVCLLQALKLAPVINGTSPREGTPKVYAA